MLAMIGTVRPRYRNEVWEQELCKHHQFVLVRCLNIVYNNSIVYQSTNKSRRLYNFEQTATCGYRLAMASSVIVVCIVAQKPMSVCIVAFDRAAV